MDDYALVLTPALEPEVLRLPAAARRRMAAGSARPDRRHRHVAALLREGRRRRERSPTSGWTRRCATDARRSTALAAWLRSRYRRRARARRRPSRRSRRRALRRPRRRHAGGPGRAAHADPAGAAASAVQPGGHRSGVASGCPACRRSPASTPASTAASPPSPSWCRCRARSAARGVQRYGFHGLSYEYIASVLPKVAPEIADGRVIVAHLGSGASLCALQERQERRQHARLHRARRALHGHAARRARSRRGPVPLPEPRAHGQGRGDDPLQEVGPARHLRHQQRHARPARRAPSRRRGWRWTTSSTARPRRSARWPRCWAASTGWSSPPASARTPPRSAGASARRRRGSGIELDAQANARERPADLAPGQPRLGLGDPDQRGTDDRPAHRRAARTGRSRAPERAERGEPDGDDRSHSEAQTESRVRRGAGFQPGLWQKEINVRDFIQQNYEPYEGDESFLAPATTRTRTDLGAS